MQKFKYLLSIVVIILTLIGCKENSTKSIVSKAPLKIAFNTWIGYSAFYIAEEQGFFEKRKINVETTVIDPLSEKNAAMLRGDLDGMGGTIDSAVISASAGVKGKVVWMFDRSNGTDGILVSEDIKSVKDLKGKSVAVEEGFVGHFFLLYFLKENSMNASDINIIPMTTDNAGAAFVAGKVDVAVTWEPYLSTAMKRSGARILVSSKQLEPILADTLFISDTVINKRPNDIQALVDSLQEANNYWIEHMSDVNKFIAEKWKMDITDINGIMATDELYSTNHNYKQFGKLGGTGDLYNYIDKCAELWLEAGVINEQIDGKALIDPKFVNNIR